MLDGNDISPHDLLRVADVDAIAGDSPQWARLALRNAPWVVARRQPRRSDGSIAVGIRGVMRHERQPVWLPPDAIAERVFPELLAARRGWRTHPRLAVVPAIAVLEKVANILDQTGIAWGPAGSVGFELASGLPATTAESDLDLVLRPTTAWPRESAVKIMAALTALPVRIDALIELPAGAIALVEYAGESPQVVLRTAAGPRLVEHPAGQVREQRGFKNACVSLACSREPGGL